MNLDLNNIFIISMNFGIRNMQKVIVALNKDDAIDTINEYYESPEIAFIVSYEDINKLYELSLRKSDKVFIWVVELIQTTNSKNLVEHEEWIKNIEELKEKYRDRDCVFYDQNFIKSLAYETEMILQTSEQNILISQNIAL